MSTLREAAQQALKALEIAKYLLVEYDEMTDAITALRAALAEHTPQQKVQEHLSDERIEDLLGIGNPTDEEKHLIRMGFNAAHGITGEKNERTN